ncbi:hypothetical protein STEG23_000872 [Scotinomys teguina]
MVSYACDCAGDSCDVNAKECQQVKAMFLHLWYCESGPSQLAVQPLARSTTGCCPRTVLSSPPCECGSVLNLSPDCVKVLCGGDWVHTDVWYPHLGPVEGLECTT